MLAMYIWNFVQIQSGPGVTYHGNADISVYWKGVEVEARIMLPCRRLSRQNLIKKELDRINLRGVPIRMVGKVLWAGSWFCFAAVATVLNYVLVVLITGVPYNLLD